jgi:steroid 5-alpha reductase family enzyme
MYWLEAFAIVNIMPWIILYITWIGGRNYHPVGLLELFGLFLFLLGSYLNTTAEYFRYVWKQKDENKGHLYTHGLFKHVRHINYLGDAILFTGLALVSHKAILLIIPISMALMFTLILIPLKENYLKRKYGNDFNEYASRTKRFIPMVY